MPGDFHRTIAIPPPVVHYWGVDIERRREPLTTPVPDNITRNRLHDLDGLIGSQTIHADFALCNSEIEHRGACGSYRVGGLNEALAKQDKILLPSFPAFEDRPTDKDRTRGRASNVYSDPCHIPNRWDSVRFNGLAVVVALTVDRFNMDDRSLKHLLAVHGRLQMAFTRIGKGQISWVFPEDIRSNRMNPLIRNRTPLDDAVGVEQSQPIAWVKLIDFMFSII